MIVSDSYLSTNIVNRYRNRSDLLVCQWDCKVETRKRKTADSVQNQAQYWYYTSIWNRPWMILCGSRYMVKTQTWNLINENERFLLASFGPNIWRFQKWCLYKGWLGKADMKRTISGKRTVFRFNSDTLCWRVSILYFKSPFKSGFLIYVRVMKYPKFCIHILDSNVKVSKYTITAVNYSFFLVNFIPIRVQGRRIILFSPFYKLL